MPSLFKITVVQHWLRNTWVGPDGLPCEPDAPVATFVKARKVKAGTPGAVKVTKKSGKWYGRLPGTAKPISLSTNKVAAAQILAERVKKAELGKAGILDPYEGRRQKPLKAHLQDYRRELEALGNAPRYVELTCSRLEALLTGCTFTTTADLSASATMDWLARQRRGSKAAVEVVDADLAVVQASAEAIRRAAVKNATTAQDRTVTVAAATYRVAVDTADAA